eukprot:1126454-Prymnesium_polylepis.1
MARVRDTRTTKGCHTAIVITHQHCPIRLYAARGPCRMWRIAMRIRRRLARAHAQPPSSTSSSPAQSPSSTPSMASSPGRS